MSDDDAPDSRKAPAVGSVGPIVPQGYLNNLLGAYGNVLSAVGAKTQQFTDPLTKGADAVGPYMLGKGLDWLVGQPARAGGQAFTDWSQGYKPVDFSESLTNPSVNREQLLGVAQGIPPLAPFAKAVPGALKTGTEEFLRGIPRSHIQDFMPYGKAHPPQSTGDYVYHATSKARANAMRPTATGSGGLKASRTQRSYFSRSAENAWGFAPHDELDPVLLRIRADKHPFKTVGGHIYSESTIHPRHIEYMAGDGTWQPLVYPARKIRRVTHSAPASRYGPAWKQHTYQIGKGEFRPEHGFDAPDSNLRVYEKPAGTGYSRGLTRAKGKTMVGGAWTEPDKRGRDLMKANMKKAMFETWRRGQRFQSDRSVSRAQQLSYLSMQEDGFRVIEHPNHKLPDGTKVADSESPHGVYEILPPLKRRERE